jgi:hypothetical protein
MSIDSVNGCDANRSGSCTKAAKFRQRTGIVKKGLMELRALASNVATMSESFSKISILRKGERAAKLSTIAMIFLATLKAVVGFLSGSIALLADAAHSSSDVLTSIAVWLGLAQKKPTERFPLRIL